MKTDKKHNEGVIFKNYIELRIENDKALNRLKLDQNIKKSNLIQMVKSLKIISISKINYFIKMHKHRINSDNIQQITQEAYISLMESFVYSNIYYVNKKDIIINYITQIYIMQLEVKKLINMHNRSIKKYIIENNINTYRVAIYVTMYQKIKSDLQYYSKYCRDIEDFEIYKQEKEGISSFLEEIFLVEVDRINQERFIKQQKEQLCIDNIFGV